MTTTPLVYCSHHWKLESPNGPLSWGECTRCGEWRQFRNSIDVSAWDNQPVEQVENRSGPKSSATWKPCKVCGTLTSVKQSVLDTGRGIYCSPKCEASDQAEQFPPGLCIAVKADGQHCRKGKAHGSEYCSRHSLLLAPPETPAAEEEPAAVAATVDTEPTAESNGTVPMQDPSFEVTDPGAVDRTNGPEAEAGPKVVEPAPLETALVELVEAMTRRVMDATAPDSHLEHAAKALAVLVDHVADAIVKVRNAERVS